MHPSHRGRGVAILVMLVAVSMLTVLGTSAATAAARAPQGERTGKWQQAMEQLRVPGKGCFTASYPKVEWFRARCEAAPRHPYTPPSGFPPQTVGNNNGDASAQVTNLITSVTGSFDSVSSGVTETGQQNGAGPQVANTFSLQLNTKPFTTGKCSGGNSGCVGWEQFLYSSTSNQVFIQYWLIGYGPTCPPGAGWGTTPLAPNDCFQSTNGSTLSGSALTAAGLSSATLTGSAGVGGNDTVVLTTGTGQATATSAGNFLGLAAHWNTAEFAVVGDCCGTQANFSAGTTLAVRTTVHHNSKDAPTCVFQSFTGETNNLNLANTSAIGTQGAPTLISDQTSSPGVQGCAVAKGNGDTHLTTFRNLFYDFQASGDFELVTTGSDFTVEARQVSGAPTWPNAAVNQAIATHIGTSNVAVCTAPTRLVVNGRIAHLPDGARLRLPDGGDVSLTGGNVYLIRGANRDAVRAEVNTGSPDWIDLSVGLNRWPVVEHGLLANAGTNVNAIEARDGTVLTAPFPINEFYGHYGNSWRVPASQSLLSVCGRKVLSGNPTAPFYASDLPPGLAKQTRAICLNAGVRVAPLLDACTIDVAVLRERAAAKAFLSEPANVTLGEIIPPPFSAPRR